MIVLYSCYSAITPRNFKVTQRKQEGTRAKMHLNNFKLLVTKQWSSLPREILTNTRRYFLTSQQLQSRKAGMWDQREVDETPGLQQSQHSLWCQVAASVCYDFQSLGEVTGFTLLGHIRVSPDHPNPMALALKINKQTRWWWSGITSKAASFCTSGLMVC